MPVDPAFARFDMARLYEKFVAQWLHQNLPPHLALKEQENVDVDENGRFQINIDLVITDKNSGQTLFVLDTKYKTPLKPSQVDISQIVTYAKAKNCHEAILVYPEPLPRPLDIWLDDLHIRSLTFPLDTDLETAGQQFLQNVLSIS